MPKFLKVAGIILVALSVLACGFSVSVVTIEAAQPNGEVVSFEVGETKAFSDGNYLVYLTYNGEVEMWTCQDNAGGQICANFSLMVGAGDEANPASVILLGGWHEVEVEEIPAPPLNQQDA